MGAKARRALIAAAVNGVVVLVGGPLAYLGLSSGLPASAGCRAMNVVAPFALVAAWRTWVHARRRLAGEGPGWKGVAEAGGLGLVTGAFYLLPALRNPSALPVVTAYLLVATVLGLAIGAVLAVVSITVLRVLSIAASARLR